MKLLTFAAGVAAGYVLGTRAGREKYEQIADSARQFRANPTVGQAQQAVKDLLTTAPEPASTQSASTQSASAPTKRVKATPAVLATPKA